MQAFVFHHAQHDITDNRCGLIAISRRHHDITGFAQMQRRHHTEIVSGPDMHRQSDTGKRLLSGNHRLDACIHGPASIHRIGDKTGRHMFECSQLFGTRAMDVTLECDDGRILDHDVFLRS